jgi:hypothetical protein
MPWSLSNQGLLPEGEKSQNHTISKYKGVELIN